MTKEKSNTEEEKISSKKENKIEESKSKDAKTIEETSSSEPKTSKSSKKPKEVTELPGVGAATAEKLEQVGFKDLMSIAVASPGELVDATGMNAASAKKLIAVARNSLEMGFESGTDLLKKRELVERISTGSQAFDDLLAGGFETGAITECFGEFGSGKTQMGLILAVNLIKQFGEDAIAVFIDTENTFRPERIVQLAQAAGLDPEKVLKNIKVARAYNSDHQMLLAEKVDELVKSGLNVKLIVVDSLTAHFRAEFVGRGTLADRQQKLNKHMHMLLKVADSTNACVYVTNQVMSKPDQFFGDPTQPIGGHIVAHASTFRIYLRKGKKASRVAKLIDSPNLPDGECGFYVGQDGLKDL